MIPPPIFQFAPKPVKPDPVCEEEQEEVVEGEDYFDLLPDAIVIHVFNRLLDAKSLCRCLAVSRRFAALVPEVDSAFVVAKPRLSSLKPIVPRKPSRSILRSLFAKLLVPVKKASSKPSFIGPGELSQWICNSIKNFNGIRDLRIELPDNGGIVGFPDTGGVLKWSAEFGKDFKRCAVIGATAFEKPSGGEAAIPDPDQNQNQNLTSFPEEDLKPRVVWILSCLIAACARHGVVRKTMLDCPGLRSAVILDARQQGRMTMNEKQIQELRDSINSPPPDSEPIDPIYKRTAVPNVIVKVWYVPRLVLPRSGYVLKGATVVAVRPDSGNRGEDGGASEKDCGLFKGGFGGAEKEEEVIAEAIKEIMKSKSKFMYKLEMNSF